MKVDSAIVKYACTPCLPCVVKVDCASLGVVNIDCASLGVVKVDCNSLGVVKVDHASLGVDSGYQCRGLSDEPSLSHFYFLTSPPSRTIFSPDVESCVHITQLSHFYL